MAGSARAGSAMAGSGSAKAGSAARWIALPIAPGGASGLEALGEQRGVLARDSGEE